jgi:hypothetical protein
MVWLTILALANRTRTGFGGDRMASDRRPFQVMRTSSEDIRIGLKKSAQLFTFFWTNITVRPVQATSVQRFLVSTERIRRGFRNTSYLRSFVDFAQAFPFVQFGCFTNI